jgi:phosphohistidine phosphatase
VEEENVPVEDEEVSPREKFIVLLRHGIAEEKSAEKKDEERSLTSEGHARMKQISRGLEKVFPKAQAIYTSPLVRAVQTALWVSKAYRSRIKAHSVDALRAETSYKEFRAFLESLPERRVIVVGHEPSLTDHFMKLIGIKGSDKVELKKGGCYGVRLRPDGTAVVEWLLSPRVLRKLSEEA